MDKKKVLVCGATGFIGRNTIESLSLRNDLEMYGTYLDSPPLKNNNMKMKRANLTKKDDVDHVINGMDIIIQAAAVTSGANDIVKKPFIHVTDNAIMNSLLFRSAFEHKVSHVIFFSCGVMYQSSDLPQKEEDFDANQEINPTYFGVGWTKVYIEKMCEFYSGLGETKYTVIRHSNIYGPYDKFDLEKSHVFGSTMTKVMRAQNGGKITVWGDGSEERDLLYISDIINFINLIIDKQISPFDLYNIGYGHSISISSLVKKIIEYSQKKIKIEYDSSKPSIKTKLCLNTEKARKSVGWEPKTSLDEGIQNTMKWYWKNIKS